MKNNQLKMGAILSYISLFISNIIGILYTPIMLRVMGESEYGLYSLVASMVGYLTILDMGLGSAIVKYIAKYRVLNDKEGEYRLNGMFISLYSIIGIIAAILGVWICINIESLFGKSLSIQELEKAKIMMGLLVFNLAISFPLGVFGAIMRAYEKFIFPKIIHIIRVIINPCIMLPLLFLGYRSVAMVIVTTLLNIICLLINVWYCFSKLHIKIYFNEFNWGILKEIGVYSFFVFLNIIVDKIYWSTDQFILGMISGTVMVAIYSVASQLSQYYKVFSTAISGVFLPRITKMVTEDADHKALSDIFIKTGRVQYIIMAYILSGFLLIGKDFVVIWAGQGYENAFYIASVIMIPLTIPLIQNIGIYILQAKDLHGFRSIVYIIIAIMNVCLSIPLAKVWGGVGCALSTGISLIIGNIIIMNIYYYKKVKLDIPRFWRDIFKMSIPVLIAFSIGVGANHWLGMTGFMKIITTGSLFTLVYVPLMWLLGMNVYEKQLFLGPIKVVRRKLDIVR